MKFSTLNRKVHYWLAIIVALPVLLVLCTGILLQLKKQLPWVQPAEQRGTGKTPMISFEQVLAACQGVEQAGVKTWDDINRIDVRPSRGMMKVWAKSNWEIQVNSQTGAVLQVAYRRSDWIESLHDGSFFSDPVKLGVFLPAGILLLVLWLTGIYLFILPYWVRWTRKRPAPKAQKPVAAGGG